MNCARRLILLTTLVFSTITAGACTRKYEIAPLRPQSEFAQANERIGEGETTVRTVDGGRHVLEYVELYPDSVTGYDPFGRIALALTEVLEVSHRSVGRGMWEGLIVGASLGGLLGALQPASEPLGSTDWSDCARFAYSCGYDPYFREPTRSENILVGVVGGALWGVVIGGLRKGRVRYILVRDNRPGVVTPSRLTLRPSVGNGVSLTGRWRIGN